MALIGCVEFSLAALERLGAHAAADLVAVVTRRRAPANADFRDLGPAARELGAAAHYADEGGEAGMGAFLEAAAPRVLFCLGWSRILGPRLLEIAPEGVIGFHPAPLPVGRGRHPIIWTLALGLEETAASFFQMDEGADSGPLVSQRRLAVGAAEDARSLYDRITATALDQLDEIVADLAAGRLMRTPQDARRAVSWRKRGPADGRLDFRMSTRALHDLVRALTAPYVGAHIDRPAGPAKVWAARPGEPASPVIEPGRVLAVEAGAVRVKTMDGSLWLTRHELAPLPAKGDYL